MLKETIPGLGCSRSRVTTPAKLIAPTPPWAGSRVNVTWPQMKGQQRLLQRALQPPKCKEALERSASIDSELVQHLVKNLSEKGVLFNNDAFPRQTIHRTWPLGHTSISVRRAAPVVSGSACTANVRRVRGRQWLGRRATSK